MENRSLLRKTSIVLLFCLSMTFSLTLSGVAVGSQINHQYVISELAKPDYQGRQAGTAGYSKAVNFLEKEIQNVGMLPVFSKDSFQLPYLASTATLNKEVLIYNGTKINYGTDYQLFPRTPSGDWSFSSAYYAGEGLDNDYSNTNIQTLAVIHWNNQSGAMTSGILDRIQIASLHGATGVAIIADGNMPIGDFEHPLNSFLTKIPAFYITPNVARKFQIPSDYNNKYISNFDLKLKVDINRNPDAKASDLLGVIPGVNESHAILWVTNIDSFGTLPDGSIFPGSAAGSAAAAMMLDIAANYAQNKPEYTQLFAFVGSKWTDQNGIKTLTQRINWTHIDLTLDIYAMGGTGQKSRLNIGFVDPSMQNLARSLSPTAYLNNDLGNSLSSVIKSSTEKLLLIRDLDTEIVGYLNDKPESISTQAYAEGVANLLNLSKLVENQLSIQNKSNDSAPSVVETTIGISKRKVYQTSSKYFQIFFDSEEMSNFNSETISAIDQVYEMVNYYNYDVVPKSKPIALFISDGKTAADICKRPDLLDHPEAAGGGFASRLPDYLCIYQNRFGQQGKPIFMGNVAHELNHAIANAQYYFPNQVELQEWQGHSSFVHSWNNLLFSDKQFYINSILASTEVPNLRNFIADPAKIDTEWFTNMKQNPFGFIYTYYLVGSMYAFLDFEYGKNISRRSIYRNYEDLSNFKKNLTQDTGLNYEQFISEWSYWMLHNGSLRSSILIPNREILNRNNQFDYLLLYSKPINKTSINSAQSNEPNNIQLNENYFNDKINAQGVSDLIIEKLSIQETTTDYVISFKYKATKDRFFAAFIPPDGLLLNEPLKASSTFYTFNLPIINLVNISNIMFNFYINDNDRALIPINISDLKTNISTNAIEPPVISKNNPVPTTVNEPPVISKNIPVPTITPKVNKIKLITISCVKGKFVKKVTSLRPSCPKGFRKK